jgi:hypothetical protein
MRGASFRLSWVPRPREALVATLAKANTYSNPGLKIGPPLKTGDVGPSKRQE